MNKLSWEDILAIPCVILNMNKSKDRLSNANDRIRKAGYKQLSRFEAIDGDDRELVKNEWVKLGNPLLRDSDNFITNYGKQGCAISHYKIWQYMIDNNIELLNVFEDDVLFHKDWSVLAKQYYELTPKNADLIYVGSSFDERVSQPVLQVPVYCTHAYIITLNGAKRCLEICLNDNDGSWTIDHMLRKKMVNKTLGIQWYIWNGWIVLDPVAIRSLKWQDQLKNSGLVFQDETKESYIGQE